MQLLRTILIIVIAYYLFKLFARYVMPIIARYFIRKSMNAHMNATNAERKNPGEINIEFSPQKKEKLDDLGEYVDYEEIEDDQIEKK